jgi:diguanylate cyclase (GGDEF)-like protein
VPDRPDSDDDRRPRHRLSIDWPDELGPARLETTVMNYCGWTTVAVIFGFVFYRFLTGDSSGALINAIIVVLLVSTMLLGRVPRYKPHALIAFGSIITVSCLMSALLVSSNGLLWTYLVLWINFLVLPRSVAIVLNLLVTVILAANVWLFDDLLQHISWITVAVLISGFSLVFTNELKAQRRMLSQLATLDPLTGAGNRRLLQRDLERAIAEKRRARRDSTLMVLDLDHFKHINDNHGHEAGDQVLEQFVTMVRNTLRTEDGLYRLGGEEFVVLLRDMDRQTAQTNLRELHERLSGRVDGPEGPLRFSAGAATLVAGENWSQWLARADRALYQAKHEGRDRLMMS